MNKNLQRTGFLYFFLLLNVTYLAGQEKPVAKITAPEKGKFFVAGDTLIFEGEGMDLVDGVLPKTAFTWLVYHHHGTHVHDGPPYLKGEKKGGFQFPISGELEADQYYRFYLIVTNSQGISDTDYVDVHPIVKKLTVNTEPPGLKVATIASPMVTPFSFNTIVNMEWVLRVDSVQYLNGERYTFNRWDHGGRRNHFFYIPDKDTTVTAYFTKVTSILGKSFTTNYVTIFPNPANDYVFLKVPQDENKLTVVIYDHLMKEVLNLDYNKSINGREVRVDVQNLKKGLYFLQIKSERFNELKKIRID